MTVDGLTVSDMTGDGLTEYLTCQETGRDRTSVTAPHPNVATARPCRIRRAEPRVFDVTPPFGCWKSIGGAICARAEGWKVRSWLGRSEVGRYESRRTDPEWCTNLGRKFLSVCLRDLQSGQAIGLVS